MRAALLLLCGIAAADDAGVAKAREIAKAGPVAAREAVGELIAIGKGSAWERFAARDALVVAGPPALPRLIEGASGDGSLRLLLEGVSFDLSAGVVAPALPLLASEDPKIRAMAAVSLGAAGKGGEAAVKKLIETLYDKDEAVRREAATALGAIGRGAHDAIPGLINLANDPARGCQREALLAMGAILRDAAERGRRAPKVSPDAADAIARGVAWLAKQQSADGSWECAPGEPEQVARERARLTALALLALLDSGQKVQADLRAAVRYLAASDRFDNESVLAALCAATRVTREPEGRAAALRAIRAGHPGAGPYASGWRAMSCLEARFAGIEPPKPPPSTGYPDAGPRELRILRCVLGDDAQSLTDRKLDVNEWNQESLVFFLRAEQLAGRKPDYVIEGLCAAQRKEGLWDFENPSGRIHSAAVTLLCLEAAAGLAHPLALPLPDAPQLKAAVATLRIAAQSKDAAIRAAAEQALAGFAVR